MLKYLLDDCEWTEERVHLFGFGQGGSVAVELARLWARECIESAENSSDPSASTMSRKTGVLGSVTTISGPLLSHPTPNTKPCLTPLLIVHRPGSSESALAAPDVGGLKKGFGGRVVVDEIGKRSKKEGMPSSRDEWMGVMRFWAEVLGTRVAGEGIYRVN